MLEYCGSMCVIGLQIHVFNKAEVIANDSQITEFCGYADTKIKEADKGKSVAITTKLKYF